MKPDHVTDLLSDFLDGALAAREQEQVKSHLTACQACQDHLEDLKTHISLLKSVPKVAPPPGLEERIIQAVTQPAPSEEEKPGGVPWFQSWFFGLRGAATVATCLIAAVAIWNIKDEKPLENQVVFLESEESDAKFRVTGEGKNLEAKSNKKGEKKAKALKAKAPVDQKKPRLAEVQQKVALADSPNNKEQLRKRTRPVIVPTPVSNGSRGFQPRSRLESNFNGLGNIQRRVAASQTRSNVPVNQSLLDDISKKDKNKKVFQEHSGQNSGISDPLEAVISTPQEWEDLWRKHTTFQSPPQPTPEVDFSKNEVIVVFAGNHSSGGYALQLQNIEKSLFQGETTRLVTYRKISPPSGSIRIMIVTQPFMMKVVPRHTGRTLFKNNP